MLPFVEIHGRAGFAEVAARARLDLYENDFAQVFGNDVYLEVTKSPVALQNLVVLVNEMEGGSLLAPLSDFVVLCHYRLRLKKLFIRAAHSSSSTPCTTSVRGWRARGAKVANPRLGSAAP